MSQVNFFMFDEDERDFERFITGRPDTLIFPDRFFDPESPKPVSAFPPFQGTLEFTLINSTLAPVSRCSAKGSGNFAGKYLFELYKDPLIEYSRSHQKDGILYPGRIYAKIGWLEHKEHNSVYRRWYASFERYLKKNFKRCQEHWWVGPATEKWALAGGHMAFGLKVVLTGPQAGLSASCSK